MVLVMIKPSTSPSHSVPIRPFNFQPATYSPCSHFMICHLQIDLGNARVVDLSCSDLRSESKFASSINPVNQESYISNEPWKKGSRVTMGHMISPYTSTQPDILLETANLVDMAKVFSLEFD